MRQLNRFLRKLFMVCGALFLLMELLPESKRVTEDNREGFDNEEFDDLW